MATGTCEVSSHPQGTPSGRIVRESSHGTRNFIYVERICPKCQRVQGITRIIK